MKGLIRTCCIVLIISIGLSVVYSAKRPYIYLIDNYDYHHHHPPASGQGAHHLHRQPQQRRSQHGATRRIGVAGGNSGNDYHSKFLYPFVFHDTHRYGEVIEEDGRPRAQKMDESLPLSAPPLTKRGGDAGGSKKQKGGKKGRGKKDEAEKTKKSTVVEQSFPFPIPWDWNLQMKRETKSEEVVDKKKNDEDRRFKLPRLPTLPTIEFQFSAESKLSS